MTDDRFDQLMRDAAGTYHRPPEIVPFEEMWEEIERRTGTETADDVRPLPILLDQRPRSRSVLPWARMAAVLMIGVALGRGSTLLHLGQPTNTPTSPPLSVVSNDFVSDQDQSATNAYLGQAAALMISLPSELRSSRRDTGFVSRANSLLLQTRLMLDSPSASDPALHSLFQDMEVVLAQVVRLRSNRDPAQVDLVTNALEQRDVLPRLRLAVADHIAN